MNKLNEQVGRTKKMVYIALLIAVELVLSVTPLGYIPVGVIRATTIHIPVIIGAILFGPIVGALLGGVFGLTSLLNNTFNPTVTSFVFSPFYSLGEFQGNFWSIAIALLPRILIGIVAYYVFKWTYKCTNKWDNNKMMSFILAGLLGSLTNTLLVMGGIYLFFGQSYAMARSIPYETLLGVIIGIIGTNGVVEAIVAALLTLLVAKPLIAVTKLEIAAIQRN
ncbi:ECF transporter S component [Sporanaerobium hydrogeniformans]|uniref:ECF transporter S component n=1 Tax=Sporanaerobium hydrogeniformans TaxID=3072179 RepID=A0AC61DG25_9FIRM|nr:ECF transporter S component [Sporanaerobium hydrogeniformans]PHV72285.1 ECF transporter S component [Sporanaerobium hydrogeniformans]